MIHEVLLRTSRQCEASLVAYHAYRFPKALRANISNSGCFLPVELHASASLAVSQAFLKLSTVHEFLHEPIETQRIVGTAKRPKGAAEEFAICGHEQN